MRLQRSLTRSVRPTLRVHFGCGVARWQADVGTRSAVSAAQKIGGDMTLLVAGHTREWRRQTGGSNCECEEGKRSSYWLCFSVDRLTNEFENCRFWSETTNLWPTVWRKLRQLFCTMLLPPTRLFCWTNWSVKVCLVLWKVVIICGGWFVLCSLMVVVEQRVEELWEGG